MRGWQLADIVLNLPFGAAANEADPPHLLGERKRAALCGVAEVVVGVRLGARRLVAGFGRQQRCREAGDHSRELVDVGGIAANAAHHQVAPSPAGASALPGLPARRVGGAFLLQFDCSRDVGGVVVGLVRVARLSAHERPLRAHEVRAWRRFMGLLVGDRNRRHSGRSQPLTPAVAGPREAGFAATRARTMTCVEQAGIAEAVTISGPLLPEYVCAGPALVAVLDSRRSAGPGALSNGC
ncbi:hypothetical protein SAMN04489732_114186 [Amycolatopsis saalfeldensis]|uniref:Uncharacterized protein n=1 Tax=Amycolatopsis saalfeldensis TaxID=394193 RepID=A0A1H8YEH1_9PSEU|nr:hypothetical protein SAMN04489732_114186 [Amycolatopsis saalfeldensis]